jgi:hypothetical protein
MGIESDTQLLKEWGFWRDGMQEVVEWKQDGEKWLVLEDVIDDAFFKTTGPDSYRYECRFRTDDGRSANWHYTAKRIKKQKQSK